MPDAERTGSHGNLTRCGGRHHGAATGRQCGRSSQNETRSCTVPAIALLSVYQNELKAYVHTQICPWLTGALSVITEMQKKPRFPSVGEWALWPIGTVGYHSAPRRNEPWSPWGRGGT